MTRLNFDFILFCFAKPQNTWLFDDSRGGGVFKNAWQLTADKIKIKSEEDQYLNGC